MSVGSSAGDSGISPMIKARTVSDPSLNPPQQLPHGRCSVNIWRHYEGRYEHAGDQQCPGSPRQSHFSYTISPPRTFLPLINVYK